MPNRRSPCLRRAAVLAASTLASCTTPARHAEPAAEPVAAAMAPVALVDSLDRLMPHWLDSLGVAGATIAIVRDGEVVSERAYGFADRRRGVAMTPATVFQVASLSKPVAAWGAMRLVQDGALSLDEPVTPHLSRWRLPPTDSAGFRDSVTVRRLLSHTAGLSVSGYMGVHPDSALPSLEASLNGAGAPEALRVMRRPGSQWQYSGGGYTLLQLLVEERTGRSFARVMRELVLDPLKMRSTGYALDSALAGRLATPHHRGDSVLPQYRFVEAAAAGLFSTAGDYARFVAAGMDAKGRRAGRAVLRPEYVGRLYEPAPNSAIPTVVGYGLGYVVDSLSTGERLVLHTGVNQGWRTAFFAVPGRGEGIVVLTNSDAGGGIIARVSCTWVRVELAAGRRGCRA